MNHIYYLGFKALFLFVVAWYCCSAVAVNTDKSFRENSITTIVVAYITMFLFSIIFGANRAQNISVTREEPSYPPAMTAVVSTKAIIDSWQGVLYQYQP